MIQEIDVKLLHHHPQNPRKDLGDLTELADSIKEQGIFQNLTVVPVPNDNGYYVVIGNRRLEASKLAGLTTLPCIVAEDMDEQTQQAVMLLENMQRNDLTLYEQAQGFQMCLDLGMSQDELKTKTGLSKRTIERRLTLLKFDQQKVKSGVERGATLQDYMDLEEVDDEEEKAKLLDVIGTGDFKFQLNSALLKIANKKARDEFIEVLKEAGIKQVDGMPNAYTYEQIFSSKESYAEFKVPNDVENYAFECKTSFIFLYKKIEENQEDVSVETEPTELELKREQIREKVSAAYLTRLNFVKDAYKTVDFSNADMIKKIMCYAFDLSNETIEHFYNYNNEDLFEDITGIKIKKLNIQESNIKTSVICSYMFVHFYSIIENRKETITLATYDRNEYAQYYFEQIKTLYKFLEDFGYVASADELDIMLGTHELYDEENVEES